MSEDETWLVCCECHGLVTHKWWGSPFLSEKKMFETSLFCLHGRK